MGDMRGTRKKADMEEINDMEDTEDMDDPVGTEKKEVMENKKKVTLTPL